jgi:hypothetical protein
MSSVFEEGDDPPLLRAEDPDLVGMNVISVGREARSTDALIAGEFKREYRPNQSFAMVPAIVGAG